MYIQLSDFACLFPCDVKFSIKYSENFSASEVTTIWRYTNVYIII